MAQVQLLVLYQHLEEAKSDRDKVRALWDSEGVRNGIKDYF